MAGEFFAVIMEGTQFERDIVRRFPGRPLPEETIQVSLYQLELCTRGLMNRCLEPARTVLGYVSKQSGEHPELTARSGSIERNLSKLRATRFSITWVISTQYSRWLYPGKRII